VPRFVSFPTAIGPVALLFESDRSGETLLLGIALPAQAEAATVRHLGDLVRRRLGKRAPAPERIEIADAPPQVREAAAKVTAHLAGEEVDLATIALDESSLTPFRARVYAAARTIPRGTIWTYAQLANESGSPRGARAVGRAMATNPWPIVVPCHRVVGAEGDLHGFSAPGGTRTKAELLRIEGYRPTATDAADDDDANGAQAKLPFG
jgi:methylated-DNA-[protein]-cysteine S-methyltransferase